MSGATAFLLLVLALTAGLAVFGRWVGKMSDNRLEHHIAFFMLLFAGIGVVVVWLPHLS